MKNTIMDTTEEDWKVDCSDEEKYLPPRDDHGGTSDWEPRPEEIVELYTTLAEKGSLELEWRCPGRRSPSVHSNESEGADRRAVAEDETKTSEPNEFDFDDEGPDPSCSPKITPRRRAAPVSSVQKRVAKFDKVVFDVRRQRELEAIDKIGQRQQPQQADSSSSSNNKR
ncbi:PAXIP1-associated glutamate-rich protein 1-like [Haemaphysalis longicornis]